MPVTVLDVALAMGAVQTTDASGNNTITMGEFDRVGLPFFSGCQRCAASLGPYNSFPSKTGCIQCDACIGDDGFATVQDFNAWCDSLEASDAQS